MTAPLSLTPSARIGWIGTGVMGVSMCAHLMAAGHPATVFNRTKAKARPLLDKGAAWADSPRAVAEASDVVFTIVGYPADVRRVYFEEDGVLAGLRPGAIAVDMTTTSPSLAVEIFQAAAAKGAHALDAPVSGGDVGAKNAALSIMVGGEAGVFAAVKPLFERMGRIILHQGPAGAGQHTKMCNQIVIAGSMIGMCESLLYATRAGLDPQGVLAAISKGAAGCWSLENLAPRILKGDFAPGFMIEHFVKDMGIALEESKRMGITLPGLALVESLYAEAAKAGHGKDGTQALFLALKKLSGL
ncbi:MAG: NAD(P)-dependent oxidoreductase [Desulfovibrio sp.]|jgi:3-hydroxyisobutyrate dehydrogenase|nr:NAD(P)-dependent oxidoreductase [Desulfovibrio sp.]